MYNILQIVTRWETVRKSLPIIASFTYSFVYVSKYKVFQAVFITPCVNKIMVHRRVEDRRWEESLVVFFRSPAIPDSLVWVKLLKQELQEMFRGSWYYNTEARTICSELQLAGCPLAEKFIADRLAMTAGWLDCMTRLAETILRVTDSIGLMTDWYYRYYNRLIRK
jgi:hypothetical protein